MMTMCAHVAWKTVSKAGMEPEWKNAIPRQGLLGFDTGMFVLDYLKNPVARYDGVQNGYSFTTPKEPRDSATMCSI